MNGAGGAAGVYVHFPYCARLCPYCDFNVKVGRFDGARYAAAVLAEFAARSAPYNPRGGYRSLYFGGGTPSLWAPADVARVAAAVPLEAPAEVTLEANPEALPAGRVASYVDSGINRVSLGAQSFHADELRFLGRVHTPDHIAAAARACTVPWSIDLIYGLPDQPWTKLAESIDRAVDLSPDHVSAYALTVEPATHFGRRAAKGKLIPMDDDRQAELEGRLVERLAAAGYERYEVSSYARPGRRAIHNSLYWLGAPYLGMGAGAHSYLPSPDLAGALRRENVRDPIAYVESALAGEVRASFEERLDRQTAIGERILVAMRARYGVDLAELGSGLAERLAAPIAELAREGLVERTGTRIAPTPRGLSFADGIARRLWFS